MYTLRLGRTTVGLISVAIIVAMGTRASGEVMRVVSPSSASGAEGNSNITPNTHQVRAQFLIPASDFAGLPASHHYIVGFNFRSDSSQTQPVNWSWPHEQTWMSTTSLNSLTTVFDANHGPDKKLVSDGAVSYQLLETGPAAGPRGIADGPRLQSPFLYDPSKGNLLIERKVLDGNYPIAATIDTVSIPSGRLLINDPGPNAPTGILLTSFPVIQFEFDVVPEPGDYNRDGAIDAADYVVWRKSIGQSGPGMAADGNANDLIDAGDYDVWRAHFGQTAGGGVALPSAEPLPAVPEPTSIMLCGFVLSALVAVRSRNMAPIAGKWISGRQRTSSCLGFELKLH